MTAVELHHVADGPDAPVLLLGGSLGTELAVWEPRLQRLSQTRRRAMIAATDAEGYASCCEAIAGLDVRAGLHGVTAPTLVIGGAQDPAIPARHSRAIAAAIPGARLEILDPGAHLVSVERAETVTELIADHIPGFLDGPSTGGPR